MANGVAGRSILKGSDAVATGPHGSFYFDEFLKAIQKIPQDGSLWTGSTGIGETLDPSVSDAVEAIQNANPRYPNTEDPARIFPDAFKESTPVRFPAIYGKVFDVIQESRRKITSSGVSSEFTQDDYDTALSRARDATTGMHQGRIADADYTAIEKNKRNNESKGFSYVQKSALNGQMTWEQLDSEASLEAADKEYPGKGRKKLQASIQAWSQNKVGSNRDQRNEKNHREALAFAQTCNSRIHGDENC
ncbi:hypothetical protein N7468_003162 [Penicillium chermesinum]|uniref:Uncharacterized protein n=1 Tax=Penicillium chermesinum TaxID=63820 RepID=A0A9W9P8J7_9EURO|nr:uncharacterized protein N7468_003162 [Penicillium chermesinum]KAJ5238543.1 hypothetical protein N7468_003162 [Penicillium chermesinum]